MILWVAIAWMTAVLLLVVMCATAPTLEDPV
jgi:hypothetical protein